MSSDVVIQVENLSKRYRIRHQQERQRYVALRDVIAEKARGLFRRQSAERKAPFALGSLPFARASHEDFWALRDVSFEVKQGEVIGIIGRNGAGKSTLLKILSRITEPTTGSVRIKGRVASLLEVGTGFHPELTGRENIFLNGAILGMTRAEIVSKFDEIVAFAEVEKFLDTPVKHYSSGMYVRLAFAVAAHLEPEILVVDEVLAVGDAEFQRKCLGKMGDVAKCGRTVLFVSHNTAALLQLCQLGMLLENGRLCVKDSIKTTLSKYTAGSLESIVHLEPRSPNPSIVEIGVKADALSEGHLEAYVKFTSPFPIAEPIIGLVIHDAAGQPLFGTNGSMHPTERRRAWFDVGIATCSVRDLPLHSGIYRISAFLGDATNDFDKRELALSFDFTSPKFRASMPPIHRIGPLNLDASWNVEPVQL
jgi:lipopolysaccharide transport system ATP-binding protein